jgi:hypothetical protein
MTTKLISIRRLGARFLVSAAVAICALTYVMVGESKAQTVGPLQEDVYRGRFYDRGVYHWFELKTNANSSVELALLDSTDGQPETIYTTLSRAEPSRNRCVLMASSQQAPIVNACPSGDKFNATIQFGNLRGRLDFFRVGVLGSVAFGDRDGGATKVRAACVLRTRFIPYEIGSLDTQKASGYFSGVVNGLIDESIVDRASLDRLRRERAYSVVQATMPFASQEHIDRYRAMTEQLHAYYDIPKAVRRLQVMSGLGVQSLEAVEGKLAAEYSGDAGRGLSLAQLVQLEGVSLKLGGCAASLRSMPAPNMALPPVVQALWANKVPELAQLLAQWREGSFNSSQLANMLAPIKSSNLAREALSQAGHAPALEAVEARLSTLQVAEQRARDVAAADAQRQRDIAQVEAQRQAANESVQRNSGLKTLDQIVAESHANSRSGPIQRNSPPAQQQAGQRRPAARAGAQLAARTTRGAPTARQIRDALVYEKTYSTRTGADMLGLMTRTALFEYGLSRISSLGFNIDSYFDVSEVTCRSQANSIFRCTFSLIQDTNFRGTSRSTPTYLFRMDGSQWRSPTYQNIVIAAANSAKSNASSYGDAAAAQRDSALKAQRCASSASFGGQFGLVTVC